MFKKLKIGQSMVVALTEDYFKDYGIGGYNKNYQWYGFDWPAMQRIFKRNKLVPKTILDAGCASGLTVRDMRKSGYDAYGMEIADYAFEIMPEYVKPFCIHDDIKNISKYFKEGSLDCIFTNALMYLTIPEIHKFLDDVYKIVNQSLYVVTPYKDYPDTIPEKDTHRKTLVTMRQWIEMIEQHGFKLIRGTNLFFRKM